MGFGQNVRRRDLLWAFAPLFLWVGFIFVMSSAQGSMAETSRFIGPLLTFLFPGLAEEDRRLVHVIVRKSAHVVEYAVLAFFAVRALAMLASGAMLRWRHPLALTLVLLVASIDEFNQSFNAARTGSVADVVLDLAGGAAMLAFLWLIKRPRMSEPHA